MPSPTGRSFPEQVVAEQLAAVARNLERCRRASGLTVRDVANVAGVARPTVWRVRQGIGLHITTAAKLAWVYGLTLAELLAMPPCACADGIPERTVCAECGTHPAQWPATSQ